MIIDELLVKINARGTKRAIVWLGKPYSFQDIYQLIDKYSSVIRDNGIANKTVAIIGDYSPYAISFFIAALANNCIVVPLANKPKNALLEYFNIAEVEYTVKFSDDAASICEPSRIAQTNPMMKAFKEKQHPGLVIFTSGSTGRSKAILHDAIPLLEKFREPKKSVRVISFLLFDHIGGINTLFYTLFNGGCLVIPQDRSVISVCEAIHHFQVEALTTTPTFLNLLILSQASHNYNLNSLRVINYGTEIMPESLLKRIHAQYPKVRLSQAYGLSELGVLPIRSITSESVLVKIDQNNDFKIRIQDGMLEVKASSSMIGYLHGENPIGEDGWFKTGDAVEVEGDSLRIMGRQSDIINIGGAKVYPAEVENVLLQMENIKDVVVYAKPNSITGNIIIAKFQLTELEERSILHKRMREFCQARLANYKIPQKILISTEMLYGERFKKMRNIREVI